MTDYQLAFIIEQALGHVTHAQNLQSAVAADESVQAHWVLPAWEADGALARLPVYRHNWTVRAGLQARQGLARIARSTTPDAVLFHTQVPAMLALDWVRRLPSVISLDATPQQYDMLGDYYDHDTGPGWLERAKWHLTRRVLDEATALVTWSAWARQGLVQGYDIPADKVTVIPPGVDVAWWARPRPRRADPDRPLRILFVGGNLQRKGGALLLDAFRRLRSEGLPVELHLVTRSPVTAEAGVFVYNDMSPNSEALRDLFFESDLFCLPTQADTLGLALAEAGASGLPLVATDIAGVGDIVRPGETGLLVPPGDAEALVGALRRLLQAPDLRLALGRQAAAHVRAHYDAATNTARLLDLLKETACAGAITRAPLAPAKEKREGVETLVTVSGTIPAELPAELAEGARPLPDYSALAASFPADLIDYELARPVAGRFGRLLERVAGPDLMLAWACFRLRRQYRTIFTDGEQIGLPLAVLLKFGSREKGRPRHLMITHLISVPKKQILLDWLNLHTHIDQFIVYASRQKSFIEKRWSVPAERVSFTPFMVDGNFFNAEATPDGELPASLADLKQPLICAVGLEFRDYPTLLEAVRDLDVQVVIAAGSPWSKREDSTAGREIPPNVVVRRFSQYDLRRLYQMSAFVVVPLYHVDFQAGITTILEAMAMGKAQICSRTPGQTDVLVDGETALYVPAEDPAALRRAICYLLDNPAEAARMGAAARQQVEEELDLIHYAERLAALVQRGQGPAGGDGQQPPGNGGGR